MVKIKNEELFYKLRDELKNITENTNYDIYTLAPHGLIRVVHKDDNEFTLSIGNSAFHYCNMITFEI